MLLNLLPSSLRGDRKARGAGAKDFPAPMWMDGDVGVGYFPFSILGRLWKKFPLRAAFCKGEQRELWAYFKMFTFPPLCCKHSGFFSNLYCENLVGWFLEIKFIWVWGVSLSLGLPGVLTVTVVHTEPLSIHQLLLKFFHFSPSCSGSFCS